MTMETMIRQIIQEENEKHLKEIEDMLIRHGYKEAPKTLSVKEAAKILGFGVTKTYELVQRYEETGFPHVKDGNRIRIPYTGLMQWMNQSVNHSERRGWGA